MNIFNSLLPQLVKYDVHTTRKINSIHAIFYHILSIYNMRTIKLHCAECVVLLVSSLLCRVHLNA